MRATLRRRQGRLETAAPIVGSDAWSLHRFYVVEAARIAISLAVDALQTAILTVDLFAAIVRLAR